MPKSKHHRMSYAQEEGNPVYFYNLWKKEQEKKAADQKMSYAQEEGNPAYFQQKSQSEVSNPPKSAPPSPSSSPSTPSTPMGSPPIPVPQINRPQPITTDIFPSLTESNSSLNLVKSPKMMFFKADDGSIQGKPFNCSDDENIEMVDAPKSEDNDDDYEEVFRLDDIDTNEMFKSKLTK